ncbi:glycine N-acyltransferase-like 3 [Crotalus adamanteus]|uniref:Glycine N-acyltransferase-like protein n=1 Tax=Crotalus adamanteus TaxID=8729 RepID=A0AAW1C7U4_CROAD
MTKTWLAEASIPKTMLVLSCPYKLRLLEGMLRKSLPQTLVVHGAVMNINRGNPIGHEVILDSWPEFKVVLTRPRKEIATDPSDQYANAYAAFYQDLDAYRRLVKDTDAVNWAHTFHLFGTQEGIPEATQDAAAAKQKELSVVPHFLYELSDPNKLHTGRLEPGFRLSSLNSSNVDLVNENWAYGGNEQSRRYLAKMIQHFPSLLTRRHFSGTCGAPSTWPAMLILTCSSKLQLLESVLRKGLPETLLVCGAVMHINRGNPAQHEVVVDSWPEFKVVLTRPQKEVVKDNKDYYANLHAAFYREEDACLQDGLYHAVKVMAEARRVHMEPYFYQATLHPDAASFCQNQLRSEPLHLGTLSPSHAALLNDTWAFASNDRSLRYLRSLTENFPNACLLDEESQPVAWPMQLT